MTRLCVLGAIALMAGCGGGDPDDARLRLVIPDNNIRTEGLECSGAQPFRHVHRGTPFAIEAEDGTVVAEGELPAGTAQNADPKIDWESDRFPTVCVMDFEADLEPAPRYRFVIEGSLPVTFDGTRVDGEERTLIVLGG
jgi:hypothetical protein